MSTPNENTPVQAKEVVAPASPAAPTVDTTEATEAAKEEAVMKGENVSCCGSCS